MPTSRNRAKAPSFRESMRRNRQSVSARRISNRELARRADYSIKAGAEVYTLLLAVLAQGGTVTVTKGTMEQVGANLPFLNYRVVPVTPENAPEDFVPTEFRVELVDNSPKLEAEPEVSITKVEDDAEQAPAAV